MLNLTDEQKTGLKEIQDRVETALAKTLSEQQLQAFKARTGPAVIAPPGQVMTLATQITLKPSEEQKQSLAELQKEVDSKLSSLLNDDQRAQLKRMRDDFGRGGPPGFGPGGGPPPGTGPAGSPGGPPGGGPGPQLRFPRNIGPPGGSAVFRVYRYGPDYPGLAGKTLTPGKTVEELQREEPEPRKVADNPAKEDEKQ
jgi:hypothetical protein